MGKLLLYLNYIVSVEEPIIEGEIEFLGVDYDSANVL